MYTFSSKHMKKFVKNIFIFIIIVSVVTGSVNWAYIKLYKGDPDNTKKFAHIPDKLQICNFGSSHGLCGFNYESISDKYNCFNFALNSQKLSYDYRLFQNYEEHIGEGTVVFITVSYFSLFGMEEIYDSGFASKNKRYYEILPPSLIKEYDFSTDLFCHYLPALGADTTTLVKTFLGKTSDNNDEIWKRMASDIDITADAKNAYSRHIEKYDEKGNRIYNQEEIDALYGLIEGCQEKGAIPVLITTPYLKEYTSEVMKNTDFYDEFYALIDKVVSDTGVKYYDYAFDERFSEQYVWFMNADHLNKEGAKKFVDILMEEIVYARNY